MDGVRYTVSDGSFPTLSISRLGVKTGLNGEAVTDKIYAERNSCIACSPIFTGEYDRLGNRVGGLQRRRVMAVELEEPDKIEEPKPTRLSRAFSGFMKETMQTITRKQMGERSYVLYEALENGQKVTFRSNFPGTIMAWNATPLMAGECYIKEEEYYNDHPYEVIPSVFNENNELRPHGTINVVKKSFLVANLKVKPKVYHAEDTNAQIKGLSETDNTFQQFTGNGMVFFEVRGDLQEIPLYPGESVDVFVGYLLGFTDGVKLAMKPAGDSVLRNEENSDFVIRLTAGEKGGFVYTHSVKILDFHKKVNPEYFTLAERKAFEAQKANVAERQ